MWFKYCEDSFVECSSRNEFLDMSVVVSFRDVAPCN